MGFGSCRLGRSCSDKLGGGWRFSLRLASAYMYESWIVCMYYRGMMIIMSFSVGLAGGCRY